MHHLYTYLVRDRMADRQREADTQRRARRAASASSGANHAGTHDRRTGGIRRG